MHLMDGNKKQAQLSLKEAFVFYYWAKVSQNGVFKIFYIQTSRFILR